MIAYIGRKGKTPALQTSKINGGEWNGQLHASAASPSLSYRIGTWRGFQSLSGCEEEERDYCPCL
jgi:hypothetical protein